jgi:hypothetical protein
MNIPVQLQSGAWLPLAPRGVAAFGGASLVRLLVVQLVFALLIATAASWFVSTRWFPVIRAAIQQMPARGAIQSGRLDWRGEPAQLLAEGDFLALAVDLNHDRQIHSPAHVQVEFGRTDLRIISLFGYWEWPYPAFLTVGFNRTELQPWWGAWEPPLIWIGIGTMVVLMLTLWALLATACCWMVWMVGFFTNRNLNLWSSWRLAGAALMPGALLMIAGIIGYGLGVFDPVKFLAILGGQFFVGWILMLVSPLFSSSLPSSAGTKGDPFSDGTNRDVKRE